MLLNREYKVQVYQARLLERLLNREACVLEAELCKLEIKRRIPGILFISLQVGSLFKPAIKM